MAIIDVVLLVLLGAFILFGLFFGFVHTLGSLLGAIVGVYAAMSVTDIAMEYVGFLLGGGHIARVVIFVLVFLVVARLFGVLFWVVEKTYDIVKVIPLMKSFNRLLGAILGFLEGVLVLGVAMFYITTVFDSDSSIILWLSDSMVADYLHATMLHIQFLFPAEFQVIQDVVA